LPDVSLSGDKAGKKRCAVLSRTPHHVSRGVTVYPKAS